MITDKDRDEEGKFKFPYECPICHADMSPEENIDQELRDGKVVSIVRCGNKGCKFAKLLN